LELEFRLLDILLLTLGFDLSKELYSAVPLTPKGERSKQVMGNWS
jgi:hypothetical protein